MHAFRVSSPDATHIGQICEEIEFWSQGMNLQDIVRFEVTMHYPDSARVQVLSGASERAVARGLVKQKTKCARSRLWKSLAIVAHAASVLELSAYSRP